MTPFITFYLVFSLVVFLVAWLKGGHTERTGVALFIAAYLATYAVQYVRIGDFRLGEAICDLVLLGAFAGLAFRGNRWWPFAATAVMVLTLAIHATAILTPAVTANGDVAARLGLGLLMVICLLAGVGERWLAGEIPASRLAIWQRVRVT